MSKEVRIQCDCGHKGHYFVMGRWGGEDEQLWSAVCEAQRGLPLLTRIKYGLQYIFLNDQHLNYTEVVWRKAELRTLKKMIDREIAPKAIKR